MRRRSRRTAFRASLDTLEDRRLMTAYGIPWPDPTHLSLSFAPDGTNDAGQASALFQSLNSVTSSANWENQILKAYQTWAVNANIDISVVSDSGAAFGSFGAVQGDPRFGDIRIGAISQSPGVLAVTQPFSYNAGTWAGDVNFNTADIMSTNGQVSAEDLYTLALHEAGHSLGLPDNSDPTSIMNTNYLGQHGATLGSSDLNAIESLYGARPPDTNVNVNPYTPTWISPANPNGSDINSAWVAVNDSIATTSDQHNYAFNVSGPGSHSINVTTAGNSSLLTRITAYDSMGRVIGSATATNPSSGNLSLNLPNLWWGSVHFTVQSGSSDAFGVGSYSVRVLPSGLGAPGGGSAASDSYSNGFVNVLNNTALGSALTLVPKVTSLGTYDYAVHGSLTSGNTTDYDRITTPTSGANVMTVSLSRLDSTGLVPQVSVLDMWGNPVATQVVQNQAGMEVVQLANASYNTNYNIKITSAVSAGAGSTGNYALHVGFSHLVETASQSLSGTLTPSVNGSNNGWSNSYTQSLISSPNGVVDFNIQTSTSAASSNTVSFWIYDSSGNVVAQLSMNPGQTASLELWLGQGTYTLAVAEHSNSSAAAAPVNFTLNTEVLSTPMLSTGYSGGGSSTTTYPPGQKTPAPAPPVNPAS